MYDVEAVNKGEFTPACESDEERGGKSCDRRRPVRWFILGALFDTPVIVQS